MSAEHEVDIWNKAHPIGTAVKRYKLRAPRRELDKETVTRSEAWVMGGHSAMVLVRGVSGAVTLDSLEVI